MCVRYPCDHHTECETWGNIQAAKPRGGAGRGGAGKATKIASYTTRYDFPGRLQHCCALFATNTHGGICTNRGRKLRSKIVDKKTAFSMDGPPYSQALKAPTLKATSAKQHRLKSAENLDAKSQKRQTKPCPLPTDSNRYKTCRNTNDSRVISYTVPLPIIMAATLRQTQITRLHRLLFLPEY